MLFLAIILLVSAVFLGGCGGDRPAAEPVSETRLLLGTVCTISVFATQGRPLLNEAFKLCAEYEAMFSMSIEGSDIWRINHAGGDPVAVSPETVALLKLGMEYGEFSGGKFDITVGRLSDLWDFTGESGVPPEADIAFARDTVDFRGILIDGNTVRLTDPEAWIDAGGVAKGYIADRLADFLKERGAGGAVIELGGDIYLVGAKPDGSLWRVGVRKPFGELRDLLGVLEFGEVSVVSSGIYERMFEENGVIYHHILDPDTGMPVKSDVISATLVTEVSVVGDILSTIVILAGSEAAFELLDRAPGFIGAVLILDNGEILQYGDVRLL